MITLTPKGYPNQNFKMSKMCKTELRLHFHKKSYPNCATCTFQADLLWGLPNLKHLERGDFLADVIEDFDEKAKAKMTNSKIIRRIPSLKVCILLNGEKINKTIIFRLDYVSKKSCEMT